MGSTDITTIATALFLIANPIGNTPAILALVRPFSFQDQKRIIFRESLIALAIALFFQFFGEVFLGLLNISPWAVGYCGGALLTIVAINMIFAKPENEDTLKAEKQEPFIVPIATPIITGPGLLAMIMLYSSQESSNFKMALAILLAWIFIIAVMVSGPYLQKILKKRGMITLEQIMGMILAFMAIDLMVNATVLFMRSL